MSLVAQIVGFTDQSDASIDNVATGGTQAVAEFANQLTVPESIKRDIEAAIQNNNSDS